MALTIKEIENAKPYPKSTRWPMVADCVSSSPRQVRSSGVWRYRFNGAEKNMHFGEYPRVTLKDARELHFAARKLLGTGINPVADRKAEVETKQMAVEAEQRQADNSFEKIAREWWSWWSVGKSPRHAETVRRRLEIDVFPAYGHKPIDMVTVTDIRKLMLAVAGRGARDVAKRIHEMSGQIFRYAIANEIATRNPAADFKTRDILTQAKTENFVRVDAHELPELLVKMDNYNGDALTRFALKLIGYTFVRTSELIEAPWPEFDLDNARWVIPPERMKMATPHIVPLSRQSVEVLRALKLLTGNGRLVFPGANDKDISMSNNTILVLCTDCAIKVV